MLWFRILQLAHKQVSTNCTVLRYANTFTITIPIINILITVFIIFTVNILTILATANLL